MKNHNFFIHNKIMKIVKFYLKDNFKLILFLIIFWFIISLLLMISTLTKPHLSIKTPIISKYDTAHGYTISISYLLNTVLFSFPSIIYFSIVIMVFINKILIGEISSNKIGLWLSSPLSRKEIFSSKNIFLITLIFFIFIPSYLLIVIFSAFAFDAKENIGYVILYGIEFIIFILFILFFYILISTLLTSSIIINIIVGLILFWISAIDILYWTLTYLSVNSEFMKFFKYLSPEGLLVSPLQFSDEISSVSSEIILYKLNTNFIILSVLTVLMSILIYLEFILNNYIFKNKDLNI